MNKFVEGIKDQEARTWNGMKARETTADAVVDLFYKIGASRGKDITPAFTSAYVEDKELALRVALWARDVRGGAGERKLYRDILKHLPKDEAIVLLARTPELGRWDDVLVEFEDPDVREFAFSMVKTALEKGDGLCAKWMPRKGPVAVRLREYLGWTPKFYRKRLVELTKVVETQMCAKDWDEINFSHVPSLAAARYKKAFFRNTPKYAEYVQKLKENMSKPVKERDPTVYVNAGAVYPYDVLKGVLDTGRYEYRDPRLGQTEMDHVLAQWEALPNFVGDAKILPMVDVSGSMFVGRIKPSPVTVAVSLGLYLAEKNTGVYKDTFLTFSSTPSLKTLKGNVLEKVKQLATAEWGMSTNLHAAMDKILNVAVKGNVPQEDMPNAVLILSDMQFNSCTRFDDSAMQMIRRKFESAGYETPAVVFWNLNAADNVPVKYDERGVALVSGFSPQIVKSVLNANFEDLTPRGIMMKTIMQDRYDLPELAAA